MPKLVLLIAGSALIAAPALADTPLQFERDGITYVATVSERDGVKYISGREVNSNRAFDLRVSGGQVTGIYGGDYVTYADPTTVHIASR